jgi:hypothetical protein
MLIYAAATAQLVARVGAVVPGKEFVEGYPGRHKRVTDGSG